MDRYPKIQKVEAMAYKRLLVTFSNDEKKNI